MRAGEDGDGGGAGVERGDGEGVVEVPGEYWGRLELVKLYMLRGMELYVYVCVCRCDGKEEVRTFMTVFSGVGGGSRHGEAGGGEESLESGFHGCGVRFCAGFWLSEGGRRGVLHGGVERETGRGNASRHSGKRSRLYAR